MAHCIALILLASGIIVMPSTHTCPAKELPPPQQGQTVARTGILTNRLSRAQFRTWKSIVDIVMAKDRSGACLHPSLHRLYRQTETSSHVIHIELSEVESLSTAGLFSIESLDPDCKRHVATIRLNLATIRRTYVGKDKRYANGLIPFDGLDTMKRYAEVLGHELAHAVGILLYDEYLQLYQDLKKEVSEYERLKGLNGPPQDLEKKLKKIEVISAAFEKPAQAAEAEIWRELRKAGK